MSRRLRVLARGRRWAIVAKPPGLPCHRSALVNERDTVAARAKARFGCPIHLVHRLDRATSGCLLIAFDPEAAARLHDGLRSTASTKRYVALVRGWWRWDDPFVIDHALKDEDGTTMLDARTTVRGLGGGRAPRASLVEATLHSGRTHQIRRHLSAIDHPVLGDTAHGDSRHNRLWRTEHALPRLALHCAEMDIPCEETGRARAVCPLPEDLAPVFAAQPWWSEAVRRTPWLGRPPIHLHRDRGASR